MNRHEIALNKIKEGTVIPATPLSLDNDRKFNEKGQRVLMRYFLNAGVGAIAGVCGPIEQAVKEAELAKSLGFDDI